jgi:hypothetical protein
VRIGTTRALEGRVSGQAQADVRAVAVPRLTHRSVLGHQVDEPAVVGARKTIWGWPWRPRRAQLLGDGQRNPAEGCRG